MSHPAPPPRRPERRGGIRPVTVTETFSGTPTVIITSPVRLVGWALFADSGQDVTTNWEVAVAATAAGTLTLTNAAAVSLITVTPAAAWPAGLNQVSVTNVSGGPTVVDIPGGTENPVVITYNPPTGVAGYPVVSVPAIVGGPAYTITAVGVTQLAGIAQPVASAILFDGGQIVGVAAMPAGQSDSHTISSEGLYIGTNVTLSVLNGSMHGVIWIIDDWHGGDN